MGVERRGWLIRGFVRTNNRTWSGRTRVGKSNPKDKSFDISKRLVWEAYKSVKANKGAAGVDGQSVEEFEADLRNNLYQVWSASSRTGGEAVSWCS
jgi:retron-type reverse transcriptase